jgi:hypothetical protein
MPGIYQIDSASGSGSAKWSLSLELSSRVCCNTLFIKGSKIYHFLGPLPRCNQVPLQRPWLAKP